jgi:glycosyltransferase involved in cell wall biosynthesis
MSRFLFYPSGTVDLPSSHLRVYETGKELEKLGHKVTIVDPDIADDNKKIYLNLAESGTIVYVQKIVQSFHKPENFLPFKKKYTIVYDVDDFHDGQDNSMMEAADIVIAGSHYVADYAREYNKNVHIACSITDTEIYKYIDRSDKPLQPIQIIWTESFANAYIEDLALIEGPMSRICVKHNIRFVLQGLRENRDIKNARYHNLLVKFIQMFPYCIIQKFMPIDAYLAKGVQAMKDSDIGIIPFKPGRVGKAGQNMRSLMSVGLGVIGTPGNEHEYIIDHGRTGFLATTEKEWEDALEKLITDRNLRLTMGYKASQHIEATYSRVEYIKSLTKILNL